MKENVYVTKAADGIQDSSAETISKNTSITGKTFTSNQQSENALRVDGAAADLHLVRIDKASGESGSPALGDFFGINAGFLATNGALATIRGSYITTNARGGNGVFSYGSGTAVNISESFIHTFKDNSGGLQTTGGGTMNANKVRVITEGNSAAAIRSDRGGGFVRIRGGPIVPTAIILQASTALQRFLRTRPKLLRRTRRRWSLRANPENCWSWRATMREMDGEPPEKMEPG